MFTVNISSVKRFHACRARWLIEWHLNRVPREGALPLNLGKLVHVAFEKYLKGEVASMYFALTSTQKEWLDELAIRVQNGEINEAEAQEGLDASEALDSLIEPLTAWKDQYPIGEPLEVEQPFEFPHPDDPNVIIRGRPDRMAPVFGKLAHIQNRTLAAGVNFGLYSELAKRDYHELVYAWAMQKKYPDWKYAGTLMNLIRKLKFRAKPTKNCPEGKILHTLDEIFTQVMVPMLDNQISLAMSDLLKDAHEMQRVIHEWDKFHVLPSPNRKLDGGPYGNHIDPYFNVFTGKTSIYDDKFFKPREDMYVSAEDQP